MNTSFSSVKRCLKTAGLHGCVAHKKPSLKYAWKRNIVQLLTDQLVVPPVKFGGGSVMVRGAISARGTGPLDTLHADLNNIHSTMWLPQSPEITQGSILGPSKYCLYSKPIGEICSLHNLLYHCYADDTQAAVSMD